MVCVGIYIHVFECVCNGVCSCKNTGKPDLCRYTGPVLTKSVAIAYMSTQNACVEAVYNHCDWISGLTLKIIFYTF